MNKFDTLYNLDSNNRVRIWYMVVDGARYYTVSGLEDGELVESEWTDVEGKNIGRANETTPEEQAILEVESKYRKKEKEYFRNKEDIFAGPKFVEPMTATKWNDEKTTEEKQWKLVKDSKTIYIQPKLDGIRCLVSKDGMFARSGDPIISCPHIRESLNQLFEDEPDLILDGELYNHEFKDNFNKISSLINRPKPTSESIEESKKLVQYHVYDIASSDETFMDRYSYVSNTLKGYDYIHRVTTVEVDAIYQGKNPALDDIATWHRYFVDKEGYEGTMVRTDSMYENKRSKSLMKYKDWHDDEWTILDISEGKGNWAGKAKAIHFENNGKAFKATFKGTMEEAKEVYEKKDTLLGKLATVKYQELTPDGAPRFGTVIKIWENGKV